MGTIGVLGAGLMGAGIAQVSAEKGLDVVLKDVSAGGLAKGVDYVAGNLDKKVKRRRMDSYARNTTLSRVSGYHDGTLRVWSVAEPRRHMAALRIHRAWRDATCNPTYQLCRKHLQRACDCVSPPAPLHTS